MIKLRVLRWGDHPRIIAGLNVITWVHIRGVDRRVSQRRCDYRREEIETLKGGGGEGTKIIGAAILLTLKLEEGAMSESTGCQ